MFYFSFYFSHAIDFYRLLLNYHCKHLFVHQITLSLLCNKFSIIIIHFMEMMVGSCLAVMCMNGYMTTCTCTR